MTARLLFTRYRLVLLAGLASILVHASVILGLPGRMTRGDQGTAAIYSATLDPAATIVDTGGTTPAPAPPKPRRAAKPRPKPSLAPPPKPEEVVAQAPEPTPEPALPEPDKAQPEPEPETKPETLAMAPVTAPPPPEPEPEPFPTHALPGRIKISYVLNSSFADGRATYEWERDGDNYVISGEAQAEGFFTLFLEGRVLQETRGKVTAQGLRPDRFTESRPKTQPEGLEFDWSGRKVTFERNGEKNVTELKDNTVDWLSMIFQLAHQPPKGEAFDLRVFTQRRLYTFRLKVLGEEEIDIPIGKVRALHLRHEDEAKNEYVDVWLGVDHHYVPVKMRYPVARNRIVVEQTATRISVR
jgi:hypothetical protein